jgi:hypothetical protein
MPKKLEAENKIISLSVLATGQLILTTENRVYEHKDGKWTPMVFADDPVDPPPPVEPDKPSEPLFKPAEEPKV